MSNHTCSLSSTGEPLSRDRSARDKYVSRFKNDHVLFKRLICTKNPWETRQIINMGEYVPYSWYGPVSEYITGTKDFYWTTTISPMFRNATLSTRSDPSKYIVIKRVRS